VNETVSVIVTILDKDYCIACPAGEKDALIKSANMLNHHIERLHLSGKVVGSERLAVMAALHIANELLELKKNDLNRAQSVHQCLSSLAERIAQALAEHTTGRESELFLS